MPAPALVEAEVRPAGEGTSLSVPPAAASAELTTTTTMDGDKDMRHGVSSSRSSNDIDTSATNVRVFSPSPAAPQSASSARPP